MFYWWRAQAQSQATRDGSTMLVRAAASLIASGIPSRCLHSAPTTSALLAASNLPFFCGHDSHARRRPDPPMCGLICRGNSGYIRTVLSDGTPEPTATAYDVCAKQVANGPSFRLQHMFGALTTTAICRQDSAPGESDVVYALQKNGAASNSAA
jgi:hypothetical protein